jgi:hypothetical protein
MDYRSIIRGSICGGLRTRGRKSYRGSKEVPLVLHIMRARGTGVESSSVRLLA